MQHIYQFKNKIKDIEKMTIKCVHWDGAIELTKTLITIIESPLSI